jgi:hypothetical protein
VEGWLGRGNDLILKGKMKRDEESFAVAVDIVKG